MAEEVGKVRAAEQGELLQAVFGHASPRTANVGLRGVPERAPRARHEDSWNSRLWKRGTDHTQTGWAAMRNGEVHSSTGPRSAVRTGSLPAAPFIRSPPYEPAMPVCEDEAAPRAWRMRPAMERSQLGLVAVTVQLSQPLGEESLDPVESLIKRLAGQIPSGSVRAQTFSNFGLG